MQATLTVGLKVWGWLLWVVGIEVLAAIKVAMVFMASNGSYGDARSHSTGNNFLFYIVLTEYSPHYLTTIFHRTI